VPLPATAARPVKTDTSARVWPSLTWRHPNNTQDSVSRLPGPRLITGTRRTCGSHMPIPVPTFRSDSHTAVPITRIESLPTHARMSPEQRAAMRFAKTAQQCASQYTCANQVHIIQSQTIPNAHLTLKGTPKCHLSFSIGAQTRAPPPLRGDVIHVVWRGRLVYVSTTVPKAYRNQQSHKPFFADFTV
jgi:hypothetical protein